MISPAVSTPANPPPTMTNVSMPRLIMGSVSFSACSSMSMTRLRSTTASSRVFIVYACFSTSPMPKKFVSLPSATTRKS